LRVCNRALTAAEIQALYYQGNPPTIKGAAPWVTAHTVTCETVTLRKTKSAGWDCEKAGLAVKSGDAVTVTIKGKKY